MTNLVSRSHLCALAAFLGAGLCVAAPARAAVTSTFGTDAGGWLVGDIANPTVAMTAPTYNATGGNPGGYISTTDTFDIVGFFAPSAYLGNQSGAIGGTFSFDLSDSAGNDGVPYPALVIYGDGLAISAAAGPPTTGTSPTTAYSFNLSPSQFDIFTLSAGNESQGSVAPTVTQFDAIMADITNIAIEADWHSGADLTGLDNVGLAAGASVSSVPEPASLSLLAAALAGIGMVRNRKRRAA